MIHSITYCDLAHSMTITPFGALPVMKNPWEAMQKCMAGTKDIIIFVVSKEQEPAFVTDLKRYGLDKYLIVDHRTTNAGPRGITNRNYPTDKLRLKLFVLEGENQ